MKPFRSVALIALGISVLSANAASLLGVEMPETQKSGGKSLVLNGLGAREATLFKVKVYVGALYLEAPSHNAEEILASPGIKRVLLHFVREVDAGKIRDAWKEAFEKNCGADCGSTSHALARLNSLMPDLRSGDRLSFTFLPGKVEVAVRDSAPTAIESEKFGTILLATWLGKNPPNSGLKAGMLGRKEP
ncbi:MAG: chalcone isomerase family protein [Oligoflexia bacterium]|nr:chalcone isomerase family protein [Oligoflexia bacterium]